MIGNVLKQKGIVLCNKEVFARIPFQGTRTSAEEKFGDFCL